MPMDGFTLAFMEKELRDALVGGRVERVNQPERDTLLLAMRAQGDNCKLLLSANANQPRAQITGKLMKTPWSRPCFAC